MLGDYTVGVYSAGKQIWYGVDTKVKTSSGEMIKAGRQYWSNWKDLSDELMLINIEMMSVPVILTLGDAAIGLAEPVVPARGNFKFAEPVANSPTPVKAANVTISERNLQKIFDKHGADFGLTGRWNPSRAADVQQAILNHVNSPTVQQINGTYRGQNVIHVLDRSTGLNVILDKTGSFIGGWKLSAEQLKSVLEGGRLF